MPDLGTPSFDASRCVDPHIAIAALYAINEDAGFPAPGNTYQNLYYHVDTMEVHNQFGDVITLTGGVTTIAVQDETIAIGTYATIDFQGDGVTVTDGGTKAIITIPSTSATYSAGDGIDISGGGAISVDLATEMGLKMVTETADQKVAVWLVNAGGLEFRTTVDAEKGAIQDKWRYHYIKGLAKGASYTPSVGSVVLDNVTSIHGETPVASSAVEITCGGLPLYCADNDILYAKFDNDGASGLADSFTTDTLANLRPIMAGFPGFVPASNMLLGHDASGTTTSQQRMIWKTLPDWLKLVTGYDAAENQYLKNEAGTIKWVTAGVCE